LDKRTELDEVIAVFSDSNVLTALAAPVVLTGPVNLRHNARFNSLRTTFATEVLYHLPVRYPPTRPQPGAINQDTIQILEVVLQRRLQHDELPQHLFSLDNVRRMALMSSGIIRDFLTLLRDSALSALRNNRRTVQDEDADDAIKNLRHRLQLTMNTSRLKQLRGVLREAMLSGDPDADQLLFENYIACYPNGDIWHRPHEALVEYIHRRSINV